MHLVKPTGIWLCLFHGDRSAAILCDADDKLEVTTGSLDESIGFDAQLETGRLGDIPFLR